MQHIFRNDEGHLIDTPENRILLEKIVNDKNNFLGEDSYGKQWYGKMNTDGTQIWVSARNNIIQDGGLNNIPHIYNSKTGLSSISKTKGGEKYEIYKK